VYNPDLVLKEFCSEFGISKERLQSPARSRYLCLLRFLAFHIMSRAGLSTTEFGDVFHRDHATVCHGLRRARSVIASNYDVPHRLERCLTNADPLANMLLQERDAS
jgi:chromosomal replication initiation ATPase DnaA